ncbi:MAG: glycoside hydrolase family 1 protein [Candidatus Omnitrophica bacterium]|nr:glycoside hydrolase family 1 protein [Candidatus Omnitrophota bacterium]
MLTFPKNFLWGAATSAHQVEGNNSCCDWWRWEQCEGHKPSGAACRHYEFYEQDFDLAKELGHNAHRLSVEWARIEQEKGKFSQCDLQHYIDVVIALKERGIEPIVTLHHFTNPAWLSGFGGWANKRAVEYFLRYAEFVVRALAPHVRYWVTVNEPTIYMSHAFLFGVWPPEKKSFFKAKTVENNLAVAHIKTYRMIHKTYDKMKLPAPRVSIAQNMMAFVPCTSSRKDKFAASLRDRLYNFGLIDKLTRAKTLDFIGVNYYSRQLVHLKKWGVGNIIWDTCQAGHQPLPKNSLGWDIYPAGLGDILLKLKKYGIPVMITENGICTTEDEERWEYISEHLKNIHMAISKGVPVLGYLYWSLMDNFEWDKGFVPRFGLIDVDYKTFKRAVRESARKFADVCRTGILK